MLILPRLKKPKTVLISIQRIEILGALYGEQTSLDKADIIVKIPYPQQLTDKGFFVLVVGRAYTLICS